MNPVTSFREISCSVLRLWDSLGDRAQEVLYYLYVNLRGVRTET